MARRSAAPSRSWTEVGALAQKVPGVQQVIGIGGVSVLDNSAQLANAGVDYVMLKPWSERGKGETLLPIYTNLKKALAAVQSAALTVVPPPAIQGIGNASGFTMMLEQRDGSSDYGKLQSIARTVVAAANGQTGISGGFTTFRASVPQYDVVIDRVKAESLHVNVGRCLFNHLLLCRLNLHQPVQRVRPDLPGLCPGGFEIPARASTSSTIST